MLFLFWKKRNNLEAEHNEKAIACRIRKNKGFNYLGDAVLGGIDGSVTTFAVVAGATGGNFDRIVIIVLGFANLIADGFSMAVSNYLRSKSEREKIDKTWQKEEQQIREIPGGERQEIRQIFSNKGFKGEILEKIVEKITNNKQLWLETMVTEEYGLPLKGASPIRAGMVTFWAFLIIGILPLIPFLIGSFNYITRFIMSSVITALAFLLIGLVKGIILKTSVIKSSVQTLMTGGIAAFLAYLAGAVLRRFYGVD